MLIQSVLFFILGIAATTLVLILLSPAIWRRALYIARKQIAAEVPLSLTEIEADRDFLRAKQAVELVKRDEKFELLAEKYANEKRQLDHAKEELYRLSRGENGANLSPCQPDAKTKEGDGKQQPAASTHNRDEELQNLKNRIGTLEDELSEAQNKLEAHKVTKDDIEKFREYIMDVAAQFTAKIANSEGASSPIPDLVKKARGKKSLAARIKGDLKEKTTRSGGASRRKKSATPKAAKEPKQS